MPNGAEQRNVNWQYPRCSGSVSLGVKEEGEFYKLLVFLSQSLVARLMAFVL